MQPTRGLQSPETSMNMNRYATKKTVAESLLDMALLLANVAQLKAVIEQGLHFKYYHTVLVLVVVSLALQLVVGVLLIMIARRDLNDIAKQKKLDTLNDVTTGLVFLTAIINVFITAFGVQKTGLFPRQNRWW